MASTVRQQILKFAAIGGFATCVQFALIAVLVEIFKLHPVPGSAIAYVLSALLNYRLNHSLTFGGTAQHSRALPRFTVVAGLGLVLNTTIMVLSYSVYGLPYLLSQMVATAVVFLWSFTGNRLWSFR